MLITRVNLTTYPKNLETTDARQMADESKRELISEAVRSACVSRNASSRTSKLTSTDSSNVSRSSSRKYLGCFTCRRDHKPCPDTRFKAAPAPE